MPKVSFSVLPQTTSYDNYFYSFGYKSLWETLLVCETFSLCLMVNPKEPKNQNSDLANFSVFLEIRQLTLSQSVSMPHFYGWTFWRPCGAFNIFCSRKKIVHSKVEPQMKKYVNFGDFLKIAFYGFSAYYASMNFVLPPPYFRIKSLWWWSG